MSRSDFQTQLVSLEPSLSRFAISLTNNADDAQDLLQDTFLKALTFREYFKENTNLKAWTFTIMRNTFINNYRRITRQNTTFDSSEDQYLLYNYTAETRSDELTSYNEIQNAVNDLSDEFRIPFQMHTEGYKYREIAKELDLCIGTVKSRIFFSRQKLMKKLPGYAE